MVNPNTKGFDHFTDEAFYYGWCENCGLGVALTDKEEIRNEILEKYLPNYKINLVDAERLEDVEKFSDDLQVILTMLRYRDSKEELTDYINENKKFFRTLIMKQARR